MARRTGAPTLQKVAIKMCGYVAKFTPTIAAAFPDNDVLLAALAAAGVACQALSEQLELVREIGD